MWAYEHSIEAEASPEAIWRLYSDVSSWPAWDTTVERVELDGPFEAGARGTLYVRGQGALATQLTEVRPNEGFADETEIPGAGVIVRFRHTLSPSGDGRTRITHRVEIDGAAAGELGPRIGPGITAHVPEAMASLAQRASAGAPVA